MDPFKSLQNYIAAQKSIGLYFLILGVLLLAISTISYFYEPEASFFRGLFAGSLIAGLLIILGGIIYRYFSGKLYISIEKEFRKDKAIFLKNETKRMEKFLESFSSFQTLSIILIILAIGAIISFKIPFVSGICVAISILFIGILNIQESKAQLDKPDLKKENASLS